MSTQFDYTIDRLKKNPNQISDFQSSISRSEIVVRQAISDAIQNSLDASGIDRFSSDRVHAIHGFMEAYIDRCEQVERLYEASKKKRR